MSKRKVYEQLKKALNGEGGFALSAGTHTYTSGVELAAEGHLLLDANGHQATLKKLLPTEKYRWQEEGTPTDYVVISSPAGIPDLLITENSIGESSGWFVLNLVNDETYGECFRGETEWWREGVAYTAWVHYADGCWRLTLEDQSSDSFSFSESGSDSESSPVRSWPLFDDTMSANTSGSSASSIMGIYPLKKVDDVYYGVMVYASSRYGQKLSSLTCTISGEIDGAQTGLTTSLTMETSSLLGHERRWRGTVTYSGVTYGVFYYYDEEEGEWVCWIGQPYRGVFLTLRRKSYPCFSPWAIAAINENDWTDESGNTFTMTLS